MTIKYNYDNPHKKWFRFHHVLDVQWGVLWTCSQNCQRGKRVIDWSDKRRLKRLVELYAKTQKQTGTTVCAGVIYIWKRGLACYRSSTVMLCLIIVTVLGCSISARSLPVPDSGPHLANDWGQPVRHRHLYAARKGLHLQINTDGKITGSHVQSLHSKWSKLKDQCIY